MNDFNSIVTNKGIAGYISIGTRFFYKDSPRRTFEFIIINIDEFEEKVEVVYKNTKHKEILNAYVYFDTLCSMLDVDYIIVNPATHLIIVGDNDE